MSYLTDLVAQYVERLVAQYRTQPKARATTAIVVKQALADDLPAQLSAAFDLDTAVGAQLDVIGRIVGVSRDIGPGTPVGFFGLWAIGEDEVLDADFQAQWDPSTNSPEVVNPYPFPGWWAAGNNAASAFPIVADWLAGDVLFATSTSTIEKRTSGTLPLNANGLTLIDDDAVNANGVFYSIAYASRATTDLSDASFRTVIRLKAILNACDGTLASIQDFLFEFFAGSIRLVDNADMTLSYYVLSTVPLSPALLALYLPKPMGVGINVFIVNPTPGTGGRLTTESGDILTTEGGDGLSLEP